MKVGILTMHRVTNFGSVLQAYALQNFLFKYGVDNELIDYVYPNEFHKEHVKLPWRFKLGLLKQRIKRVFFKPKPVKLPKIQEFIENDLKKSKKTFCLKQDLAANYPSYDIYVTGSDQVWNTKYLKGDNSFMFPFLKDNEKRISYASSFGVFNLPKSEGLNWLEPLSRYSNISVREKKAQKILDDYMGIKSTLLVDPTLLLSKEEWIQFSDNSINIEESYILLYLLDYAWNPFPYAETFVRHYETLLGYKVVVIEPQNMKEKYPHWIFLKDLSPRNFVNVFNNAALIITSSFHGTAFSINLERPFYSIINNISTNDDRIESLCELVGLEDQLVPYNSEFPDFNKRIYFDKSRNSLQQEREKSKKFLMEQINKSLE